MARTRKYHRKGAIKKYMQKRKTRKTRKTRRPKKHGKRHTRYQRGGKVPFVGYAWNGGKVSSWPGVKAAAGISSKGMAISNHFKVSPYGVAVGGFDPAIPTGDYPNNGNPNFPASNPTGLLNPIKMNGGRRKRRGGKSKANRHKKRKHRGGGLIPTDLKNLGRNIIYSGKGLYSDFAGNTAPINPMPYDQPIDKNYDYIGGIPPNIPKIYKDAGKSVAAI